MADIWKHPQGANFCPRCGTLLVFTDAGAVSCDKCDYSCGIKGEQRLSARSGDTHGWRGWCGCGLPVAVHTCTRRLCKHLPDVLGPAPPHVQTCPR